MADISIVAASVLRSSSGQVGTQSAGAAITQGQVLYMDTANSNVMKLADSNAGSVGDLIRQGLYIALNAASTGQPISYVTLDSAFATGGTLATSAPTIWLSNTPGGITATLADLASGSTIVQLGVVNTDLTLNFNPLVGGTK